MPPKQQDSPQQAPILDDQQQDPETTKKKQTLCPKARLRIHLDDLSHPAITKFTSSIPLSTLLEEAIHNVQAHLFTPPSSNPDTESDTSTTRPPPQRPITPKPTWQPQEVRSLTLILRPMDGVAYTTGTTLDEAHKEIHLSLDYITAIIKKFYISTSRYNSRISSEEWNKHKPKLRQLHEAKQHTRAQILEIISPEFEDVKPTYGQLCTKFDKWGFGVYREDTALGGQAGQSDDAASTEADVQQAFTRESSNGSTIVPDVGALELDDSSPASASLPTTLLKADASFLHEIRGVVTHEAVHAFQHNGHGSCPGGLIEGIADYVRMKAGLGAEHWNPWPATPKSRGEKWDEGYQKTAWFLEWVEEHVGGMGCIGRLNESMRERRWEDGKVWEGVMHGLSVKECWDLYKGDWESMNKRHEGKGEEGDGEQEEKDDEK